MEFITSQTKAQGLWRNLLVVVSDTTEEWPNTEIMHSFPTDEGIVQVYYYTDGLYRHIEESGKHYYWFLYNETRMTIDDDSVELAEIRLANDILMGVEI